MLEALHEFAARLAGDGGGPHAAFKALEALSSRILPVRLFTLTAYDDTARGAVRVYSNMPEEYPVTGRKPVVDGHWATEVIERKRIFVANDYESIAAVFPDHEKIRSLGCEAVINIPAVVHGRVLGTVNCLHAKGAYSERQVAAAGMLALPGAVCFLIGSGLDSDCGQRQRR